MTDVLAAIDDALDTGLAAHDDPLTRELQELALALKAERGEATTVVAGGTFLGILVNQRLLEPSSLLSLARVPGLDVIEAGEVLRLGAMVRHRTVEQALSAFVDAL